MIYGQLLRVQAPKQEPFYTENPIDFYEHHLKLINSSFIGVRNKEARATYINAVEYLIHHIRSTYPYTYSKRVTYTIRSKYNKRKRKKLRVGEHAIFSHYNLQFNYNSDLTCKPLDCWNAYWNWKNNL